MFTNGALQANQVYAHQNQTILLSHSEQNIQGPHYTSFINNLPILSSVSKIFECFY